jgi:hypothetical protein
MALGSMAGSAVRTLRACTRPYTSNPPHASSNIANAAINERLPCNRQTCFIILRWGSVQL